MPRANSFVDDDVETFPLHVRLAHGVDRSWQKNAKCRSRTGVVLEAWSVRPKEEVTYFDGVNIRTFHGSELIALALEICKGCPAQWDCANYCIQTSAYHTYIWGTWGAHESDMRWLKHWAKADPGADEDVIERARAEGVPVQVAVKAFRADQRTQIAC